MLKLIKSLKRRTPLGWLQLSHEKTRLLVALAGIAFSDILIFMQLGFQTALYASNTRLQSHLDADIVLLSPNARNLVNLSTFPRSRLYQAMDVPGVETADPMYVQFSDWKNPQTRQKTSILVIGFNPDRPAFELPELQEYADEMKLPNTVAFDRNARGAYDEAIATIDRGETVKTELENHTLTIAGLYEMGASFAADGTLMTSDRNFLRLFPRRRPGGVSLGILHVEPGRDPEAVAQALDAYLPKDVDVLTKEGFIEFEKHYWATNTAIGFVFTLGTIMGFIVGIVIVYQVLSTDVRDRLPEYATFKAMGYRNRYLLGIVFEEAVILAFIGFFPGVGVSLGLYALTRNATNLPLYMTLFRAIQVLTITLIMCGISGAIATRKLQAADPADIFG
ncbi:ABC transporter permease protein [Geitlerinema sp. FC II]|nr:ABC transporter permease DevC [Geitlerinema sp. CS-897]PPT06802.1 ABC transporter permease protein [Geitlerinema sp. FC II]